MAQSSPKPGLPFSGKKRINAFYVLGFIPILLVAYFSPFSAVIPIYGLLLLLMKSAKLDRILNTNPGAKLTGLTLMAASFVVSYAVGVIYPNVAFYGVANYVVYLLGLLILFFGLSGVKTGFTSLFLIVAASSSALISAWLKPYISPYTNDLARIIVGILRIVGVDASIIYWATTPVITFKSLRGGLITGVFIYECIGIYSLLVFSIILVVVLFEDPCTLRMKLAYSVIGVTGTFAVNILRVVIILVTDYFYGTEVGGTMHYIIGYVLFSAWLMAFLYIYSRRKILYTGLMSIWKGIIQLLMTRKIELNDQNAHVEL